MLVITGLGLLAAVSFSPICFAAIGPVTDLNIVNAAISPDGFSRSLALLDFLTQSVQLINPP